MRLFVTIDGRPAIIVGYGPGKSKPVAIVMGLGPTLEAVDLDRCMLPKLPKRLNRKLRKFVRQETVDARSEIVALGGGEA